MRAHFSKNIPEAHFRDQEYGLPGWQDLALARVEDKMCKSSRAGNITRDNFEDDREKCQLHCLWLAVGIPHNVYLKLDCPLHCLMIFGNSTKVGRPVHSKVNQNNYKQCCLYQHGGNSQLVPTFTCISTAVQPFSKSK